MLNAKLIFVASLLNNTRFPGKMFFMITKVVVQYISLR